MKKIAVSLIAIVLTLYATLMVWYLETSNIEYVSLCVTHPEGDYVPQPVCEYYLFNFRGTEEDIEFLEQGNGLSFFFGVEDRQMRRRLMRFFLEQGISIHQPSEVHGLPPLHTAVLMNEPRIVEFLLENGADPDQRDLKHELTVPEYVDLLRGKNPQEDRSKIEQILKNQA
ncbi:hypothetical protein ACMDCT_15775 [Halomonadaceae bacterium KBTZ08]